MEIKKMTFGNKVFFTFQNGFNHASGLAIGDDGRFYAISRQSEDKAVVACFGCKNENHIVTNAKHANDCTFYNGYLYIARGGKFGTDSRDILMWNVNGHKSKFIPVKLKNPKIRDISGIAHVKGSRFLLSKGSKVFVCDLFNGELVEKKCLITEKTKNFQEYSMPQGIFYRNNRLYRIFSKSGNGNSVADNVIVEYKACFDGAIQINSLTPKVSYFHNSKATKYSLFEIEAIDCFNGQFFAHINIMKDKKRTSGIYELNL